MPDVWLYPPRFVYPYANTVPTHANGMDKAEAPAFGRRPQVLNQLDHAWTWYAHPPIPWQWTRCNSKATRCHSNESEIYEHPYADLHTSNMSCHPLQSNELINNLNHWKLQTKTFFDYIILPRTRQNHRLYYDCITLYRTRFYMYVYYTCAPIFVPTSSLGH